MALSFAGNDFIRREVHPSHGGAGTLCAHHQIHIHLGWGRSRAHEQSLILLDAAHNGPARTTAMMLPRRKLRRREFAVFRGRKSPRTRLLVRSPTSAKEDKKSDEGWSSTFCNVSKQTQQENHSNIIHTCTRNHFLNYFRALGLMLEMISNKNLHVLKCVVSLQIYSEL